MSKSPEVVSRDILLRAGIILERLLPNIVKTGGPEYIGKVEIVLSIDVNHGTAGRVRAGVTMMQG